MSHQRTESFHVKLLNWNDELPTFEHESNYEFFVNETIKADTFIGHVKATDRDVDDKIEYV